MAAAARVSWRAIDTSQFLSRYIICDKTTAIMQNLIFHLLALPAAACSSAPPPLAASAGDQRRLEMAAAATPIYTIHGASSRALSS